MVFFFRMLNLSSTYRLSKLMVVNQLFLLSGSHSLLTCILIIFVRVELLIMMDARLRFVREAGVGLLHGILVRVILRLILGCCRL